MSKECWKIMNESQCNFKNNCINKLKFDKGEGLKRKQIKSTNAL